MTGVKNTGIKFNKNYVYKLKVDSPHKTQTIFIRLKGFRLIFMNNYVFCPILYLSMCIWCDIEWVYVHMCSWYKM